MRKSRRRPTAGDVAASSPGVRGGATTSGGLGAVPAAPVFHPTAAEFASPLDYIASIRPLAEPFGICRIVPPPSFTPPFALPHNSLSFPTKSQPIHRLLARPPDLDPHTFALDFSRFLRRPLPRSPLFDSLPLDLCRLFYAVKRFRGYHNTTSSKKWGDVARFLRPGSNISKCSQHVLSQIYREHLLEYEEHQSGASTKPPDCKRRRKDDKKSELDSKYVPGNAAEDQDQICEQCKSGLHADVMLLCDRCDKGWHLYCLSPPMEEVPPGNWYCLECVNSGKESFGFVPGKQCTLEKFKRIDERAKRKWLGQSRTSAAQIEKRFWEIVEGRAGEVEVKYGSELDTKNYGSGFPRVGDPVPEGVDPEVWKEYANSPWNLNNLPKLDGSLLRVVQENITGVMVPWLYIGMLFSSFCWHMEDHCFYSINYLHWGEPKCWYGVPGTEASSFEKVMRNTLPDLFDAQPDLLFQLVTMLSPSVLQENGVPVYSALQEPGNFIVTFPKSFHGGFNFGLNCAEAVNFASADWLPHGGFGAELYRLYRRPAVLSHEELLCVVAKNSCDIKTLSYLKEEMERIFVREKTCREELWRNDTVRSSVMSPKKHSNQVGTEEDPTCVICQQYLYLSAVVCSCRSSAFACLEHWKHLCECDPSERRLLYRHTLADLGDIVRLVSPTFGTVCNSGDPESRFSQEHQTFSNESSTMSKKVNGGYISYAQLAEDWLSNACHVFESPFSEAAFASSLKEAEQFLWADHEMNPVRDMTNKIIEAQEWSMSVRNSLSKLEGWLACQNNFPEKVSLCELQDLLSSNPLPCYEPGHVKLKVYVEEANVLLAEVQSALSSCVDIDELENLHSRAIKFPINLDETRVLSQKISARKVLMNSARQCLSEKIPDTIDFNFLKKLKSEMLELHVRLPETDLIVNLCEEAKLWQARCKEILIGPLKLEELQEFLCNANNVTVLIPELCLLRQNVSDGLCWRTHLHNFLQSLKDREDHKNIVEELSCILKSGESLRVQGNELSVVEMELKRSHCRQKASEILDTRMPLELIRQLLDEASLLKIENEKMFLKISSVLTAATSWEERANYVLGHAAQMSEFEDVVQTSEKIFALLPSLPDVMNAISEAQSWVARSQPYLLTKVERGGSTTLLQVDDLKNLVSQSEHLKVASNGLPERLESILNLAQRWELSTRSLLEYSKSFLYISAADLRSDDQFSLKFEDLLKKIESAAETGASLGFEFDELPTLNDTSLTLQWCLKTLSLCFKLPVLQEVDCLLDVVNHLPARFSRTYLVELLIKGARCLRKALSSLPEPQSTKKFKLKDIEEILEEIKESTIPFTMMVGHLQNAVQKHESWVDQVRAFFEIPGQSFSLLVKLKEHGCSLAFDCPEFQKVSAEIEKVEKWILQCLAIVDPLLGNPCFLVNELSKIKDSMHRALCIFRGTASTKFCSCWPNYSEEDEFYPCLTCEGWYHFSCIGPPLLTTDETNEYVCPFCICMETGDFSQNGGSAMRCRRNRPELQSLIDVLHISEDFCARVEERELVQEIVTGALEFRTCLTGVAIHASCLNDKELRNVSESLLCSLKATTVVKVYDHQIWYILEEALSRTSWKIRVKKLLKGLQKPSILQVQGLLEKGLAIHITSDDHFMQEITKAEQRSLQWVEIAKKVALDLGAAELDEVFKLITVGETLPVQFAEEMELLRERSVLYCICRKPYDQKAMIACDQCDEWYHFDCIDLVEPPSKTFLCPACKPVNGKIISFPYSLNYEERLSTDDGPPTPPASHNHVKIRFSKKVRSSLQQKMYGAVDLISLVRKDSEMDGLWRESRRPLQRTARKR